VIGGYSLQLGQQPIDEGSGKAILAIDGVAQHEDLRDVVLGLGAAQVIEDLSAILIGRLIIQAEICHQ